MVEISLQTLEGEKNATLYDRTFEALRLSYLWSILWLRFLGGAM